MSGLNFLKHKTVPEYFSGRLFGWITSLLHHNRVSDNRSFNITLFFNIRRLWGYWGKAKSFYLLAWPSVKFIRQINESGPLSVPVCHLFISWILAPSDSAQAFTAATISLHLLTRAGTAKTNVRCYSATETAFSFTLKLPLFNFCFLTQIKLRSKGQTVGPTTLLAPRFVNIKKCCVSQVVDSCISMCDLQYSAWRAVMFEKNLLYISEPTCSSIGLHSTHNRILKTRHPWAVSCNHGNRKRQPIRCLYCALGKHTVSCCFHRLPPIGVVRTLLLVLESHTTY